MAVGRLAMHVMLNLRRALNLDAHEVTMHDGVVESSVVVVGVHFAVIRAPASPCMVDRVLTRIVMSVYPLGSK